MNRFKQICLSIMGLLLATMTSVAQGNGAILNIDFAETEAAQDWTIADANGDGLTWSSKEGLKGLVYDGSMSLNVANDWAFTPEFNVESGKHYMVTYTIAQRGSYGTDVLDLYLGKTADITFMTTKMVSEKYDFQAGQVTRYCHVIANETGSCVVGLKIGSEAGNGLVSIKSIKVEESLGQCPTAVLAMDATPSASSQTVKVRWINPKKDTLGASLFGAMKALIYQDDVQVAEVDNMVPGDTITYIYTPEDFNGKHIYSVAMKVDGESEKVSKEIDLDDVQGTLVQVKSLPITKANFSTDWVVDNKNGGETWTYYGGSAYVSAMGKTVNDWLISPACDLEPGKRYVLTYKIATSRDYPASFDVTMGTKQTAASQTTVITRYTDLAQNGYADFESTQFEVPVAGTYYFGFHATYVGNSLDIKSIVLNSVEAGEEPEEVPLTYVEAPETILPDNDNFDLTEKREYGQRISMEGVELTGVFTQAQIDQYTLAPKGFYAIEHLTGKYAVTLRENVYEMDLGGGCVYHEGRLYCNEYNFQSDYQFVKPVWKVLDAKTFEVISADTLNTNCENTTVAMTYDITSDKMYGIVRDYVDMWLVEINPENGQMKRFRSQPVDYWKRFLSIGCDDKGNLFAIYMTEDSYDGAQKHYICRINKTTGDIADIGEIQGVNMFADDLLINMKYCQQLFFNNNTKKFYWMFCSSSMALGGMYTPMFEVDPVNGKATLLTYLENVMAISGMYFNEPMLKAPGIISDFEYVSKEMGSLEGVIKFKVPATSYDGSVMTTPVKYVVAEKDGINFEGTASAGQVVEIDVVSTQGVHNLEIQLSNEIGEGPVAKRTFLIGYDMPAAPQNIMLTDSALTTTLSWSAPQIGVNGQEFDKSILKYDVVRYPEEITVASGITDTVFVEKHGSDLLRYYYVVYSCNDTLRTRGVVSNAVVVGDPILPPYGGVFQSVGDMYNYYTILDVNKDQYTWVLDTETGAAVYPYNWQQGADDWMISPPIRYDAGAPYQLVFSTFSTSYEYPESMKVTIGKDKTPEGQTEVLLDLPTVPAQEEDGTISTYTLDFTVPESGVYYYGFKAYSKEYQEYLFLYNIQLLGTTGVQSVATTHRNFDAYANDGSINVINPTGDVVTIYNINGMPVATTDNETFSTDVVPGIYIVKSSKDAIKVAVK